MSREHRPGTQDDAYHSSGTIRGLTRTTASPRRPWRFTSVVGFCVVALGDGALYVAG